MIVEAGTGPIRMTEGTLVPSISRAFDLSRETIEWWLLQEALILYRQTTPFRDTFWIWYY